MKTQIIQLEPHDDVISTRDKMGWSQTSRILLVWPDKGKILDRRLDLVILARHGRSLGSQLALVTGDSNVKSNARQLGIPVYKAPRQAQDAHWRMPPKRRSRLLRRSPPPDLAALKEMYISPMYPSPMYPSLKTRQKQTFWAGSRIVYWIAFFSSIAAILALAVVLLPGASIHLVPHIQVQEVTLPVSASEKITTLNLAGSLPASRTTIVVEGRSTISTTGTVNVPVAPASGSVQFNNLTEKAVTIPTGTLVSTLGAAPIWFVTTREDKVAAGIGKTVLIPIRAVNPGASGNLSTGKIQAVSGLQGLKLSVTNPTPTRRGADKPAPAPDTDDRNRLYNRLLASLSQTAMQELQNRYAGTPIESGFPILSSLKFSTILEKTYTPAADSPAEQLQLSLRLEFEALEVSPQDLQNLVRPLLDASLPEGFTILPDTLTITALEEPVLDKAGSAHWVMQAQRHIQALIAPEEAVQLARGLPVEKARQHLQDRLPLEEKPLIRPAPSWWPYTPFLSLRIQVEIDK